MQTNILAEMSTEVFTMDDAQQMVETVAEHPDIIKDFLTQYGPIVLQFAIRVGISILAFWIGTKIIKTFVGWIRKSMERHGTEVGVTSFLCTLIHYSLDFVLIMIILGSYGLTGSIVAVLGSAGLTVGLALQGSLSNFAGGVLIILLKPFVVGDYIIDSASQKEGTVMDISLFYTRLLTIDNKMIMIPNGTLSNSTITNVSSMEKRRVDIVVGVAYESDLSKVKELLLSIVKKDEAVLLNEPVDVFVSELGESSIDMGLRVWVNNADYWTTRWRILEEIKTTFEQNDIAIPFPQIDVHHISESGK